MVYSLTHGINRAQNATHLPINIVKPIDKATPLLGTAISDNEVLHLTLTSTEHQVMVIKKSIFPLKLEMPTSSMLV